jgi:hypothetical protein
LIFFVREITEAVRNVFNIKNIKAAIKIRPIFFATKKLVIDLSKSISKIQLEILIDIRY